MAEKHIVKAKDTLNAIIYANWSKIAGSTLKAKQQTLLNISANHYENGGAIVGRDINYIVNDRPIYFSDPSKSSSSGGSTTTTNTTTTPKYTINKAVVTYIGVLASAYDSDAKEKAREVTAIWEHSNPMAKNNSTDPNRIPTKNKYVDHYICHWEEYREVLGKTMWFESKIQETASYEKNDDWNNKQHDTYTASAEALKVRVKVLPVSGLDDENNPIWSKDNPKVGDSYVAYKNSDWATYDFADNYPFAPDTPKVELDPLDDTKLIVSYDSIDPTELNAKSIHFNVVKNNTTTVYNVEVPFTEVTNTDGRTYTLSHSFKVEYGNKYKVRAQSIGKNGKTSGWSAFCENVETRPCAPKEITSCYCKTISDGSIAVHLEWSAVSNAEKYVVEYTTREEDFKQNNSSIQTHNVNNNNTSCDILDLSTGSNYYFRVKAVKGDVLSDPTKYVEIQIGTKPSAPTTWNSVDSVFAGQILELNWTHNSIDGSDQTYAQIAFKINDEDWYYTGYIKNDTKKTDENPKSVETEIIYERDPKQERLGWFISYKGTMYFRVNTECSALANAKILWRVCTVGIHGIDDEFEGKYVSDWSTDLPVYVYKEPIIALSVTKDEDGNIPFDDVIIESTDEEDGDIVIRKALTSFPFYIRATVELDAEDYAIQRPIGYYIRITSNDFYETVDAAGRTKIINPGDTVYSQYFDILTGSLIVEMSANNIDLEPLMAYTVHCDVSMSTGHTVSAYDEFNVYWQNDIQYFHELEIYFNEQTYEATIRPVCLDDDGAPADNVTLSLYRREYNGELVEIATNIPNTYTSVTDPHPSLDYARYRLIAKSNDTGAVTFYDAPGHRIGCSSVIIQWDEDQSRLETLNSYSVESPPWSGSLLVLPYNIKVSDARKREVSTINYAGREYPVSYHGVAIDDSSTWSTVVPKSDTDTIYMLRCLSLWSGRVYAREPSGMGFWATITVSFNMDYDALTVPVTLNLTRVEGGA